MRSVAAFFTAFLLGSLPTAYLWVKARSGKDIRTIGSGNVGATNVFRALGKTDGIWVLLVDALKGVAAVLIGGMIQGGDLQDPRLFHFALGLAAILGHVFTPWLRFKGGKGVATGAGVVLVVYPLAFSAAFLMWLVLLKWSRIMSLASILSSYFFVLAVFITVPSRAHTLIALGGALFITWTHRANIDRLRKGTEPRLFHK